MTKFTKKVSRAAGRARDKVETKILVAEGKRSLRSKVDVVKKVTRKAVKAGAVAGAIAAVSVVIRETKKRRRLAT